MNQSLAQGRLTRDQRGALRRMINLSQQLPDDWSGMMPRTSLQEDFGALRFQLAYMAYAMALTHVHRLPAAPGLFREPMRQLVEKLRSPDVWSYWHYVSTGGSENNRSLGPLPAEWNPIIRDNIMYSAYLQVTALLYHYLFDDDRYAEPGALTLRLKPLFWHGRKMEFVYDEKSLTKHVYWQMVESGYLGVACEPNCIFQICNQVPIHAFRFHDLIYGGDVAGEVTEGYRKAWNDFGLLDSSGHFNMLALQSEGRVISDPTPWSDFWAGALMNAWNPQIVRAGYPTHRARWVREGPDGTAWVDQAHGTFLEAGLPCAYDLGWAAVCAGEVGDIETRDRLLAYADARLHRDWDRGGLFYRRHDEIHDENGFLSAMCPHAGNVLLGYARLNIVDGLKQLYEGHWTPEKKSTPAIIALHGDIDLEQAYYDGADRTLRWTAVPIEGRTSGARFTIGRQPVDHPEWRLFVNGEPAGSNAEETRVGVERQAEILVGFETRHRTEFQIRWD